MLKITGIDKGKLTAAGFTETPNGFSKEIPNCFRFCYTLYILPDDIYGTITRRMGSDKVLDFEKWLEELNFRNEEKPIEVKAIIADLQASGAITVTEVQA